ncbi:beta-N-acetylhexosaminidase [Porticoccus sp. W117]|uniref:beta-N-acetylhexosaminidase n=1 Tax=Porticoccus sp. W117 TaxID=3054777 RepID=UPI0025923FCA|nr:beta-N-acetylhexosaminidase [Porticoccus sp. W117]MDM3869945.1 beta-N-acetylhexosaminidase [Porticoccus sp. W117]
MLDLEGTALTADERHLLQQPQVGGVIFFARNFESRKQICTLVEAVRAVRPELLLAVDQEGGRVQRFKTGFTRLPAMQKLGDLYRSSPEQGLALCRDAGWLMASEIRACGIDFSFAPVLDLDTDTCEVIADRAFSDNPDQMVACAGAFIEGMAQAGMAATGKHFPGHGAVLADSHLETPYDDRPLDAIRANDLIPFARLAGSYEAVMPAHMVFPKVVPESVGFSRFWLQEILRGELAFDGVIFSDDLSMKGADVAGGYAEKAAAALSAGCDMVLVCNCREGALEVLDYLQQQPLPASDRLQRMAGKGAVDWQQLQDMPRYLSTQQQLQALPEA